MATLDWPATRAFAPQRVSFGVSTPKAAWAAPLTGQVQSVSHLSDRLTCSLTLPPCSRTDAGKREAFFMALASTGDWVRLGHQQRLVPMGTLRGTPTIASTAAAGVRSISVQGVVGDTLLGGDVLGAGGMLLLVGYAGATANGSGVLTVPLVLPTRAALTSGNAVTWSQPTTTWQITSDAMAVEYLPGRWQSAFEVNLREVA